MTKSSKNTTFNETEEDEIDFRSIVFSYLRHWKWFVLSISLSLLIGAFTYLRADREYEVTTSLLLKEDKAGGSSTGPMSQLEDLGLLSTTNNIDNEIAVLSSPNLMRQIVQDLELHTSYFEGGLFRDTEVYIDCPYIVQLENTDPNDLKGGINLSLTEDGNGVSIVGTYNYNKEENIIEAHVKQLPASIELPSGLGKLAISYRPQIAKEKRGGRYHIYIQNVLAATNSLLKQLVVGTSSKKSSVLKLDFRALNTHKAVDILTAIVKVYNVNNVQENNETALNASKFVTERLDTIKGELKRIENLVVSFKEAQGITDISAEAKLYIEQTGQIQQKRIEIETQLKTIELVEDFIQKPANQFKMLPNLGITDPGLVQVIGGYNSLLMDYEQLERSTNQESPTRQRALSNLTSTREAIISSVNNVKRSLSIPKRELEKQASEILTRIHTVPTQERGLLEIMREHETTQALYISLMAVGMQTDITMASTSDKAKVIIDPFVPEMPVSPKRNMIIFVFILLGLLVPILIIYVRQLLQVNIVSREELEKLAKVSVIGEIMQKEEEGTIVVQANKTTPIVELFRTLRNNVKFILADTNQKVILVTSTVPGEGKTFVSVNLAVSFILSDKKVLLIGIDTRNPQLANDMGFAKGLGLTSYLSGGETDWKKLLVSLPDYPSLDILQAGVIPPNPNELLLRPALKQLIEEASEIYDIIIVDSAPIGVVSDTFLLAPLVHTTVYVTRENVTPKKAVAFINEVHEDKKLPNMYLVINGVERTKNKARYGRYGYGYTYGYGENK